MNMNNYKLAENKLDSIIAQRILITTKPNPGFADLPEILFCPIVDGKELNVMAETEDVAYLLGLQHKYDGANSKFCKMACRMLGITTKWAE